MTEQVGLQQAFDLLLDPARTAMAQQEMFAAFAGDKVEEFETAWKERAGKNVKIDVAVDGDAGKPIDEVNLGGEVMAKATARDIVRERAIELLEKFVRVRTGGLKRSLAFFGPNRRRGFRGPVFRDNFLLIFMADYAGVAELEGFNAAASSGFRAGLIASVVNLLKKEFSDAPVKISMVWRRIDAYPVPGVLIE